MHVVGVCALRVSFRQYLPIVVRPPSAHTHRVARGIQRRAEGY